MGTPPIEFGSIGMADSLILMVMALVVFGPRRLPQIGRQIGKLMYEFRKASNDFKFQMEEELRIAEDADRRKQEEERRKQLALDQPAQESVSADPPPARVNAIESPYPGEEQYPEMTASESARVEETTPRIMPPSTGETVAATRPVRVAEPVTGASDAVTPDDGGQAAAPAEKASATEPIASATEVVSHNG
ncbi:MAG: twin-arginine translocase TatA/TatE family subunit [Terracidiphilus sp.]